MGKRNSSRSAKKKEREKKLRRERNLRRNEPRAPDDYRDEFDIETALELLHPELTYERVMRRIAHVTGRRQFADAAEVETLLAALDEATSAKLTEPDPRDQALDLAFLAREPENREFALDLLDDALDLDPECADALCLLGVFDSEDDEQQIAEVEHALTIAERDLREPLQSAFDNGSLWSDVLSRPYLRTRHTLASVFLAQNRFAEAMHHAEAVIALEAGDPISTRELLIGALLGLGHHHRAAEHIDRLSPERSALSAWSRALQRWLEGDPSVAAQAVRAARRVNPMAEARILDPIQFGEEDLDEDVDADAEFDATSIGLLLGPAWAAHEGALEWLRSGVPDELADEAGAN